MATGYAAPSIWPSPAGLRCCRHWPGSESRRTGFGTAQYRVGASTYRNRIVL